MERPGTPETLPRWRRVLRWVGGSMALLVLTFLIVDNTLVYEIPHERDPSGGAVEFLRRLHAKQLTHLERHGRYIGTESWVEWPPGDFPHDEGVEWGTPREGPWAELGLRPHAPLFFKLRVRASEDPGAAEEGLFTFPVTGPWFVLQARADLDRDGTLWLIEMSSASPHLYTEHEGE